MGLNPIFLFLSNPVVIFTCNLYKHLISLELESHHPPCFPWRPGLQPVKSHCIYWDFFTPVEQFNETKIGYF